VKRFDKVFFETDPKNLDEIKKEFPFSTGNDAVWLEKIENPLWRNYTLRYKKKYTNFEPVKSDLEELLSI
jgi:hypothetical protein